jgi:fructuronate reductase
MPSLDRLRQTSLATVPRGVRMPDYDRASIRPGIVHIGIGAFHRAHMAVYVDALLGDDPNWGIIGASLRRPDTRNALAPQDYLYSLTERSGARNNTRIIGSVLDIIDASAGSQRLIEQIAYEATRIVSLTITEKGYLHDGATGRLRRNHPDIRHDLQNQDTARSVPGVLVAALKARRDRGLAGITVLSCDNLPGNGNIARQVVLDFAEAVGPELAKWIEVNVSFPSTMVDRIVPATTDDDRSAIARHIGAEDAWPVITEPFSQWVIEDNFVAGRPQWEAHGVTMTNNVEPFEHMKLRMLNGAHSTMAYLGRLAGHEFVSQAVRDPAIRSVLDRLMHDEVMPTVHVPGIDLKAYWETLLERFANPSLNHRLRQIAMDGSQKLPQRILAPLLERAKAGGKTHCLSLALAAWITQLHRQYSEGVDAIQDPLSTELSVAIIDGSDNPARLVDSFLHLTSVFGPHGQIPTEVRNQITAHVAALMTRPLPEALAELHAA